MFETLELACAGSPDRSLQDGLGACGLPGRRARHPAPTLGHQLDSRRCLCFGQEECSCLKAVLLIDLYLFENSQAR